MSAVVTLLTYWIVLAERPRQARVDAGRLQRLRTHDRLDQELLRSRPAVEPLVDLLAKDRPQHGGDEDINRDRDQHDQGELDRKDEHHPEEDEGEDEVEQRGQALAGEKLRIVSSSRMRATVCPAARVSK